MKVHNKKLFTEIQEDAISILEDSPRYISSVDSIDTPRSYYSIGSSNTPDSKCVYELNTPFSVNQSTVSAPEIEKALKYRSRSRFYFPDRDKRERKPKAQSIHIHSANKFNPEYVFEREKKRIKKMIHRDEKIYRAQKRRQESDKLVRITIK